MNCRCDICLELQLSLFCCLKLLYMCPILEAPHPDYIEATNIFLGNIEHYIHRLHVTEEYKVIYSSTLYSTVVSSVNQRI
jgi:hypothetical protein